MAGTIQADPAKIRDAAASVEADARSFKSKVDELYAAVDTLAQSFTGTDGQSYITKIRAHQATFESLNSRLMASAKSLQGIADEVETAIRNGVIG